MYLKDYMLFKQTIKENGIVFAIPNGSLSNWHVTQKILDVLDFLAIIISTCYEITFSPEILGNNVEIKFFQS